MLMVYVSHPWGGKRGNEINADEETTKLQFDYEDVVFVVAHPCDTDRRL